MSALQGCTDDKAVVESFKEALKQRVGADRFGMWFTRGVSFDVRRSDQAGSEPTTDNSSNSNTEPSSVATLVIGLPGQFAVDRVRKNLLSELRAAAAQVCSGPMRIRVEATVPAMVALRSADVPADPPSRELAERTDPAVKPRPSARRPDPQRVAQAAPATPPQPASTVDYSSGTEEDGSVVSRRATDHHHAMTMECFIRGPSNELAHTAATIACQEPGSATPLVLYGPSGIGKTHLLAAIADQFRRRHRLRRVIQLSAEQFTNDFIKSVGSSGLPAFRRRYRDVDALLVDDVQFLAGKNATLREMLFTVETLASTKRPLVFTANQSPLEIPGLSKDLAGRIAAGLVCPLQPLDVATRESLLRRLIEQRCPLTWPEQLIVELNAMLGGDGRVIQGVVNLVGTLQRMYRRMPTMDEIRCYGGEMLRSQAPAVSMSAIERAVCEAFELEGNSLRGGLQTRSITEPRMLAMYLSRQLTSSAYSEIARHFGGRSHSTAIAARRRVESWLEDGKAIGRGRSAVTARQAIDRVENILRTA